jgi:DNA polymerase-3 subunit epsilon/CBS domain-containing protein
MFEKPALQRAGLSSATSLALLSAISLDTETTGLAVARARVIEIGACRLNDGDIVEGDDYAQLVDPQEPIPARSTAAHGIKDSDVAGQPHFRAAARRFAKWAGGATVIGYSIGFDLAILERECRRANLEWVAQRSLDVRHLVSALGPSLPDNALDTVAAWLGVEIAGRHRALGDAVATAKVLRALVPRLAERGIRTLAEAEAAARNHRQRFPSEVEAGWHEAVRSSELARASVSELARIDSYPYRHRVRDVMSAAPITVSAATALAEVLKILIEQRCSSVFVEPAGQDPSWGIVTERDLLRVIHADAAGGLKRTAGEAASRPLETVPADAFLYRAIGRMARRGYRHLAAADATGNIVGAVTSRNLLGQRAQDAISLGDAIEEAQTPDALGQVWARLALVAKALVGEEVDARDVAAVASRELCALTRRAAQIAERDMADEGLGAPPVPYALMVLGSGGRGESLLAMDQDNAIVYASGEPDGPEDRWMAELGRPGRRPSQPRRGALLQGRRHGPERRMAPVACRLARPDRHLAD